MHAKRDYYRNAFNRYSTNMKNTWQTISETLNCRKGNRDFQQEFKLSNGKKISVPKQIADAYNDVFVGIGDVNGDGDVDANTINDFNQYMPSKTNCTLMLEQITVDIISRIIGDLKPKTSTGVDNMYNCTDLLYFNKHIEP